jgi:hypothetical protein
MKALTIQQIAAFHTRQHGILSKFPHRSPWGLKPYRAMTNYGRIEINPEELDRYDRTASICCRFLDASVDVCRQIGANVATGKWVPISYDPQKALDDLERGLVAVNARPLTEAEAQHWQEEDARREAEFAEYRRELQTRP